MVPSLMIYRSLWMICGQLWTTPLKFQRDRQISPLYGHCQTALKGLDNVHEEAACVLISDLPKLSTGILIWLLSWQVKNMSVLLFFHNGGSYNAEEGKTTLDGSYLAAIGNVVVVMANYRVGVFGFLSTGKSWIPRANTIMHSVTLLFLIFIF